MSLLIDLAPVTNCGHYRGRLVRARARVRSLARALAVAAFITGRRRPQKVGINRRRLD